MEFRRIRESRGIEPPRRQGRGFAFGFLHDEPAGVIAITEKGHGKNVAATRLYLYTYVDRETVYLLTIGDKRSQNDDVQYCKRAVEAINANPNFGGESEEGKEDEDRDRAE